MELYNFGEAMLTVPPSVLGLSITEKERLDEFDKEEWFLVCKKIKPELTRKKYDKLWEIFTERKQKRGQQ